MKNLGVIFGGVTCEHDVSVVTALQLMENINKQKYNVIPIYIHSDGKWYTGDELLDVTTYKNFSTSKDKLSRAIIPPDKDGLIIYENGIFKKEKFTKLDVVIPAMHGMNGEDGTIQGLLELANIPYTSSGVLSASVGMDKILMKKVFEAHGLPVLPYTYFIRKDYENDKDKILSQIESTLRYPMYVKPSNLGSSIGISKATDRDSLIHAIEVAISFDSRIIVENGVENIKEINCSAIGYEDDVEASVCEEPVRWKDFLTFEDKYLSGGKCGQKNGSKTAPAKIASLKLPSQKSGSMNSMDRRIPAPIPDEQTSKIKQLTIDAFKALNSKGVVRIDYIIDEDSNEIFINEINTIPGSFSFYLWQYSNLSYSDLIDKIVEIAEKANKDKNRNNYTYESNIIGKVSGAVK